MNREELLRLNGGQARFIRMDEPDQEYVINSLMDYIENRYNIEQQSNDDRKSTETLEERKANIMNGLRIIQSHYYPMNITKSDNIPTYHMTLQIEYRTTRYPNCTICIGIADDDMKREFSETGQKFIDIVIRVLNQ